MAIRTINRDELSREICKDTGCHKYVVDEVLSAFENNVKYYLSNGHRVRLSGFGTFLMQIRAPRTGRNPHTGEAVPIPARYIPVFKPGDELKRVSVKPVR